MYVCHFNKFSFLQMTTVIVHIIITANTYDNTVFSISGRAKR